MEDVPPPYNSLCWAVTRTAAYVEAALRRCDLTSRQYRMLVAIAQGPLTATALAARIGVAPPSATIMVRGLIQRGAVRREVSAEDQRRIWLSVTEEGAKLLDQAESLTRDQLARIAEHFHDDERGGQAIEMLEAWNPALDAFRIAWLGQHRQQLRADDAGTPLPGNGQRGPARSASPR